VPPADDVDGVVSLDDRIAVLTYDADDVDAAGEAGDLP
jgi:hypothetical protein